MGVSTCPGATELTRTPDAAPCRINTAPSGAFDNRQINLSGILAEWTCRRDAWYGRDARMFSEAPCFSGSIPVVGQNPYIDKQGKCNLIDIPIAYDSVPNLSQVPQMGRSIPRTKAQLPQEKS